MNKTLFLTLTLFTLILTACASNSLTAASGPGGNSSTVELPAQTKLILGTINLEETDNAVTAEQAKELLPLFYVLQDLNESDTAAQEEIDGLVNQIQETMTSDQIQAIADMNLTRQDMFALVQGNNGAPRSSQTGSTSSAVGGGAGGPPDIPAGGFPGGSQGGIPNGGFSSTGATSANSDTNAMPAMNTSTPSALFDAVIELLQKKVQS